MRTPLLLGVVAAVALFAGGCAAPGDSYEDYDDPWAGPVEGDYYGPDGYYRYDYYQAYPAAGPWYGGHGYWHNYYYPRYRHHDRDHHHPGRPPARADRDHVAGGGVPWNQPRTGEGRTSRPNGVTRAAPGGSTGAARGSAGNGAGRSGGGANAGGSSRGGGGAAGRSGGGGGSGSSGGGGKGGK